MTLLAERPPDVHVMPTNDILEHQESRECWCDPEIEEYESGLVIHNAFDGRE